MADKLEKNWKTFRNLPDEVKNENHGRVALLHDGELVAIYNDSGDAYSIGCEKYGLGNFSLQTFGEKPVYLSWRSQFIKAPDVYSDKQDENAAT